MPTYYIYGKDDLLIRDEVVQRLGTKVYTRHYGEELSLSAVIELLTSSDLFSIEEAHWIDGIKELKVTKGKESEAFGDAISSCLPNKFVAFTQNLSDFKDYRAARDYESRNPLHNVLKNSASEFYDLKEKTYPDKVIEWAIERAKKYGLIIGKREASEIAEASASLPQLIDGELLKLAILKTSDKPQKIEGRILKDNLTEVPSEKIFAYIDSLFERKSRAIYLLEQLFEYGAEGPAVLAAIFRRFDLILRAIEEGDSRLDEVKRMPYDARARFKTQVRSWDRERISRACELIAETDFGLKTSRAPHYDLLAALTAEVMEL